MRAAATRMASTVAFDHIWRGSFRGSVATRFDKGSGSGRESTLRARVEIFPDMRRMARARGAGMVRAVRALLAGVRLFFNPNRLGDVFMLDNGLERPETWRALVDTT